MATPMTDIVVIGVLHGGGLLNLVGCTSIPEPGCATGYRSKDFCPNRLEGEQIYWRMSKGTRYE